ncbi:MAG: SdiA-regulated domain-containing protein [Chloroherpetonaceae bacterium]|nr:SdiA-regulated domain-containing protein [Chloroherpetonaceae bacterium]
MSRIVFVLWLILAACETPPKVQYVQREVPTTHLKLKAVLPIESAVPNLELSGLALYRDTLYAICDDHGDMIFRLRVGEDKVVAEPFVRFPAPSLRPDFEGLDCDSCGNFYIVSESECRIFFVSHDGAVAKWLMPSFEEAGKAAGLFQKFNAYPEGLALISPNEFFVAAERSPRGLIRLVRDSLRPEEWDVKKIYVCDYTAMQLAPPRVPDFAGLHYEQGRLFALARNHDAIVELSLSQDSVFEAQCWSYREIAARDSLQYSDMRFGLAEGLTMSQTNIYVVYDTNGDHRKLSKDDRRPLLFIFERPPER